MMTSTNKIIANALVANAGANSPFVSEYKDYVCGAVRDLIQKVGDVQSHILQQSDRLKALARNRGTDKDLEELVVIHRRTDAALDAVSAQLRKAISY